MNIPTTIIYQMGKVGSTSINHALTNREIHALHAHWMQYDYPEAEFSTKKLQLVHKIKHGKVPPLKIIVPIREPVGRNISAFFQNLVFYCKDYRTTANKELRKIFLKKYNINYPDEWFHKELMDVFNFNPYNYEFDHSLGYKIYKVGKHKILIIRLEDSERILSEAIYKILKIENIEMLEVNNFEKRRAGTFMADKYRNFKNLGFPEEFLNKSYNLEYAQYFYTEEERNKYKERWVSK